MRHSELAHVVIRVPVGDRTYLLLNRNKKWNDWSLVGGHVEPGEEGDWARTAIRECEEELAPLKHKHDFILVPLLREPVSWGPVASRSANGAATRYTAQFFVLEFKRDPEKLLAKLPANEFTLVAEECLSSLLTRLSQTVALVRDTIPGGLARVPTCWAEGLSREKIPFGDTSCDPNTHSRHSSSRKRAARGKARQQEA